MLTFFVLLLFGKQLQPMRTSVISLGIISLCVLVSLALLHQVFYTHIPKPQYYHFTWFHIGNFRIAGRITLDVMSVILLAVTSVVSFLVHLYAVVYMQGEQYYHRFFAFLSLFTVAMYGLLLTDNLLIIYIFWELVGLCSYLLISFWHEKQTALQAAKKAFLINRFGDIGFFVALALLWHQYNTLSINEIAIRIASYHDTDLLFWAGLGLCVAAAAKSAQLPFSMWLPDAMEAPTPVSALLHAATMVAAGAYLLIRVEFLFTPTLHTIVMIIGISSAFTAAVTACFQTEMKKILAFSTISQLGLMFVAVGLEMPELAFFHLITHAFFKANLFLSVGYFMKMDLPNDKKIFSLTYTQIIFIAYAISAASLAGVPFTSGFLSKELILYSLELQAANNGSLVLDVVLVLFVATSFCTAYYITRQGIHIYKSHIANSHIIAIAPTVKTELPTLAKKYNLKVVSMVSLAMMSLFFPFSSSPFQADFFIQNARITYAFDTIIFFLAMFVLCLGSVSAWIISHYRYKPEAQEYNIVRYLNLLYNTLLLQLTVTALRFTSSAAFHQNYFVKMGHIVKFLARYLAKNDVTTLDKGLHISVITSVSSGYLLAWFDKNIADGFIRLTIWFTGAIAQKLRTLQNGKIQFYLGVTVGSVVLMLLVLWYYFL
jgi:NADH-quinone oxidoreductase subunit L